MSYSDIGISERCSFSRGDYIDGKYFVDDFLGEGTFGQVYRVKDKKGNTYALKLLKLWEVMASERPNLLKRFEREFETGQIKSEYLVHSIQKGVVKGNAYMVMEYCMGGDLNNAVRTIRLDLPLLMSHVLLGLKDLHENGKVHRDLKPENVLLRDNRHAVLTDFGIAGDQNNRLTGFGWTGIPKQRFGTIAYMPPEQINPKRGNATVLPTTDIFSFGVMMYQMLTSQLPFGDLNSESDVPKYVMNGKEGRWNRNLLKQKGKDWVNLIEACLEPDFKKRLQTVDDVMNLLPGSISQQKGSDPQKVEGSNFKKDTENGILLRIMQGEELGKVYVLDKLFTGKSNLLFMGRDCDDVWNHIGIKEEETSYVSRRHCTIEKDSVSRIWIIRDGQFRVSCPTGIRRHQVLPCKECFEIYNCGRKSPMQWKESLNGTYVNSNEVTAAGMLIKPGDIISIGDVKMRVEGA